jgi:signal transduction histidine kinase
MLEPSARSSQSSGVWRRIGLFWKLVGAFALVILIGVGGALFAAARTTEAEFRRFAHSGEAARWETLTAELIDYYDTRGSWEGVAAILARGQGQGRGAGGPRVVVADSERRVVADQTGGEIGRRVDEQQLATGIPITLSGARIGTLLTTESVLTAEEQSFLDRTRAVLTISGAAALGVALAMGALLARSITHPLRQLVTASHAVAAGDLRARVPVRSGDEVGELAAAFNRMASELDEAERARQQQAADIAHELRTPLTVIQGQLEALADGIFPADPEHLAPALRQAQVLGLLIEDLRTLSLADAGRLPLHRVPTDLHEWAIGVVQGFGPAAAERRIRLHTEVAQELPMVSIDRERMAQVLGNLLSNALRHTPEGDRITLRIGHQEQDGNVVVSLSDTGPGVPPEQLARIFERFWRGEPSRSRRTGGSGLGLSIARRIVEAHGGRIWAENVTGGGLRVIFALPGVP